MMDSPIFWLALAVIIPLFCVVWIRSAFIDWGFTGDEGLGLSIMLNLLILTGAYTMHEITKVKDALQNPSRPKFYRLSASRKNWWWRMIVFLVGVFSVSTAYKYFLLVDFIKAFVVIVICGLSIYFFSVFVEILSYTSRLHLTKQS